MMPTMTNDRSGKVALRVCRLLEVYRAAQQLSRRARKLGRTAYELNPADVLALRSSLATAALVVEKEGTDEWDR